jgi:1-deoxy-D-xylulose-5-phosphate synthase
MSSIPGMIIAAPSTEEDMRNMLYTAQTVERPMTIRYPRGRVNAIDPPHTPMHDIAIGHGRKLRSGTDAIVLSLGPIATDVAKAIDSIEQSHNKSVAHYDMLFLKPIDEAILQEAANTGAPIITVEDASRHGGLGSATVEWLTEHGYTNHVTRIGVPDCFVAHGTVAQLRKLCGMDTDSIATAIEQAITATYPDKNS